MGDIRTTLNINFEWRRLISDAVQSYADSIIRNLDDALVDDYRNKFQALLNDLYTAETMVQGTYHGAYVYRDTNFTVTSTTQLVPIPFNNIVEDSSGYLDLVNFPTRVTIPEDGTYLIGGALLYNLNASNDTFYRRLHLRLTDNIIATAAGSFTSVSIPLSIVTRLTLTAGDYIELCASSNIPNIAIIGGTPVNIAALTPAIWIERIK